MREHSSDSEIFGDDLIEDELGGELMGEGDFFFTAAHWAAFDGLRDGLDERAGILAVTGRTGAGKSALIRRVVASLDSSYRPIYIRYPDITFGELVEFVAREVRAAEMFPEAANNAFALRDFLCHQADTGEATVIIIDDAGSLASEVFDMLPRLAFLGVDEDGRNFGAQIILAGSEDLESRFRRPAFTEPGIEPPCFELRYLSSDEMRSFVRQRLAPIARYCSDPIAPTALMEIERYCGGNPRQISKICGHAMLFAAEQPGQPITALMIKEAAEALMLSPLEGAPAPEADRAPPASTASPFETPALSGSDPRRSSAPGGARRLSADVGRAPQGHSAEANPELMAVRRPAVSGAEFSDQAKALPPVQADDLMEVLAPQEDQRARSEYPAWSQPPAYAPEPDPGAGEAGDQGYPGQRWEEGSWSEAESRDLHWDDQGGAYQPPQWLPQSPIGPEAHSSPEAAMVHIRPGVKARRMGTARAPSSPLRKMVMLVFAASAASVVMVGALSPAGSDQGALLKDISQAISGVIGGKAGMSLPEAPAADLSAAARPQEQKLIGRPYVPPGAANTPDPKITLLPPRQSDAPPTQPPVTKAEVYAAMSGQNGGAENADTSDPAAPATQTQAQVQPEAAPYEGPAHFSRDALLSEFEHIAPASAKELRAERSQEYMSIANALYSDKRFADATTENAYAYFRAALWLDPGNADARAGIARIRDVYTGKAQRARAKKEWDLAGQYFQTATRISQLKDVGTP